MVGVEVLAAAAVQLGLDLLCLGRELPGHKDCKGTESLAIPGGSHQQLPPPGETEARGAAPWLSRTQQLSHQDQLCHWQGEVPHSTVAPQCHSSAQQYLGAVGLQDVLRVLAAGTWHLALASLQPPPPWAPARHRGAVGSASDTPASSGGHGGGHIPTTADGTRAAESCSFRICMASSWGSSFFPKSLLPGQNGTSAALQHQLHPSVPCS